MTVGMSVSLASHSPRVWPEPRALLTLIKPITWFPPMWAYLCGVVSSGGSVAATWPLVILGILLAGPIVCGMSVTVRSDRLQRAFQGSRSSIRLILWSGMRARVSASQA